MTTSAVRNKKIGMIKIAQKQLSIPDDVYRIMLVRITGKESCADMSFTQLNSVLDEMIKKGFKIQPKNSSHSHPIKTPKYLDPDERDKVLSLWIALADIGVVRDRSDQALAKYCQKLTGKAHWRFNSDYGPVIEGLKAWYYREALKQLCAKLGITNVMDYVHSAIVGSVSQKHQRAKTINQISSAMAKNTFIHIASLRGISDPVEFIKEVSYASSNTTKTA